LTLRENTERPITISQGTNLLVGTDPAKIVAAAKDTPSGKSKAGRTRRSGMAVPPSARRDSSARSST